MKRARALGAAWGALAAAMAWGAQSELAPTAAQESTSAAPVAASSPIVLSGLAATLEPIRERHRLPALAAAVFSGDDLVALGATGLRRSGGEESVLENDRWHLGSCTKAMTATLCARLVERGSLRWDTRLEEVFPELAARMDPGWRGATLHQLLAHRGGAPATLDAEGLWAKLWQRKGTPREQRLELVHAVTAKAPVHAPGSEFVYSNAGYAIAGAMAETVTGSDFEELMTRELFEPLGMSSAAFGAPGSPGIELADAPWGHRGAQGGWIAVPPGPFADNPPAIAPAGTVHCSLSDWARFAALHAGVVPSDAAGKPYLSAETLALLHQPVGEGDYALGWVRVERTWAGGAALTHAGSNTMWYCVAWLAPEKRQGVLVATNAAGEAATLACDEAAGALLQLAERWNAAQAGQVPVEAPPDADSAQGG